MANNKIQVKRTSTSGRTPNTTNSGNAQYIAAGELALNMADGILYTSNGSVLIPVGANIANQRITGSLTLDNDKQLRFNTVNTSAYSYFVQQSDDNFVFYTTNGSYSPRAIFSIYANSSTSDFQLGQPVSFNGSNVKISTSTALYANGSAGSAGQILASNGSTVYWVNPSVASVNTNAQWNWTNTHSFSANVAFTGNNISLVTNTGSIRFAGSSDANWRIGRSTGAFTKSYYTNNTLDFIAANSNLEGIAFGFTGDSVYLETGYAGTFTKNPIYVGNSSVNVTINSTSFSGTANNSTNLGGVDSESYLRSDTADIFSGGVLQIFNDSGALGSATGTANTIQIYQGTANADAFMTFHVSGDTAFHFGLDGTTNDLFVGGWSLGANKYRVWHQNNDGAGSGLDADTLDGSHASEFQTTAGLSANVATLAANAATYLNGKTEGNLNVNSAVYATNSVSANNADYLDGQDGTYYAANSQLASYALLAGANFTGNVTANNANTLLDLNVGRNLTVAGNLTITGNVTVVGANTLEIVDNFIYLNSNNTTQNEDIGIAGNYNDGTYRHTGIFRDATDGFWKVFDSYEPEPDAAVNIDTSNLTFKIADFWANTIRVGNTSVYSTINTTSFSGTANNASYLGGIIDTSYLRSDANDVFSGSYFNPSSNTILLGNSTARWVITANSLTTQGQVANATGLYPVSNTVGDFLGNTTARWDIFAINGDFAGNVVVNGLIANGSLGTAKQVLYTDGTKAYWGTALLVYNAAGTQVFP